MSSRRGMVDNKSSITDSFFGGKTNSLGSPRPMPKKQGLQGMGMPIPMSFPVPDKPLPDLGWGEDTQISASRKTESKRDSGSKKHLQSPAKHSRSKGREQEHDRDRVTSLNSTPSGALVKLLVAEESTTRKTRKLLDSALDRLQSASQRAVQAETQKRKTEDDALIQHAQLTKDVDEARRAASKAQNEVEMYKLRLHQLEMETAEARETIRAAQEMREDAERSAAKARATARKFKQEVAKTAAKARGRQEGYFEGLQRGRLITGMGYDYIPGDGSAYIEEVGTDAEEEFNNQRRRLQDRERDVSAIRTPYGIESGRTASSSRHHPRREPHRDPRRGDDRYTAREYDNRRQRDHHPRRERSRERHYEDNQGRHQEKYRHGYHAPESHPSSVDARTNYSGYNPRPVQDPPQDIPDGVPVSMPEPMPHIPTPPQTVVSSNDNPHNNNPLSPPQLPAHTPHQEPPPPQPQVPTVIINLNTPAATNGGLPSPPKVTVSTVPAGAGPKSVPFAPLSVPATSPPSQPPVLPSSPPQRHPRASTVPLAPGLYNDPFGSIVYPDLPLPDGESPVPRFTFPTGTTLYSEAAANAALSAGGVPFSPGLYRDSDGRLARPQPTSQPITQPGPVPPGVPRSSPDSETPSTMTGISSINHLKSFPMRVPTAEGSISGSDRGGGSRVGIRPIGTYGFARELSTIHEHSREGTPSGGGMANSEPRSVAVDQWRRSLTGSPNHLRPPSRSGSGQGSYSSGDLRRKQSSTTTGSSSIQIHVQSPSPAPSSQTATSIHTAREGDHGYSQPQHPGYLSPHHEPKHLISPDPEPDEPPVIPRNRAANGSFRGVLRKNPTVYEDLPRGFVANSHAPANGHVDPRFRDLTRDMGQSLNAGGKPYYSRDKVRRRSHEYSDSENEDNDYTDDDDDDDEQFIAPPGAVTGGMPLNVPLAPGIGPNYHPYHPNTGTGLNLMSFPVYASNGSLGSRGSGDSGSGSVSGTPRMHSMNINGMPPGFSRPATTASGKSSRRSSRSIKAPGYDIYANTGQGQSVIKPANMQMPSAAVPQYGPGQPTPHGSTITPAVHPIPEPTVPQYPATQPPQHGSSITPAVASMPQPEVPQFSQTGPGSSITAAAFAMPEATVLPYTSPSTTRGQQGSAITNASMTMPSPNVPQFSQSPQPSFPEPTVSQYSTNQQTAPASNLRTPYGAPGSSRITAPNMSMPAPSSNITAAQMSMPTPGSGDDSVKFPTPNVVNYTGATPVAKSTSSMPSPSVPQYSQIPGGASNLRTPYGAPGSSRITAPKMAMPAPSSNITAAQVSMPTPGSGDDSVKFPTPNVVNYTGATPVARSASSMPSPSVPQYSQTPGGSTMTLAQMSFPEPSSAITEPSMPMPEPPGTSKITPARLPFPEPTSAITAPQTEMPHPTSMITAPSMSMPSASAQYTPGGSLANNPLPLPPRMTPSMSATMNLNPSSPVIPGNEVWSNSGVGGLDGLGTPNLSRRSSLHAGTTPSMAVQPLPVATVAASKKKKKKGKKGKLALGPADSDDDDAADSLTMRNTVANANSKMSSTSIYR